MDVEDEEGARWLERARRLGAMASMKSSVNAPWPDDSEDEEPSDGD